MPQVSITLAQGRTSDKLRSPIDQVHHAVLRTVNTRPNTSGWWSTRCRTHWATGNITLREMDEERP